MIQETDPDVFNFVKDLQAIRQLKNISFKAVQDDILDVKSQFKILENEVEKTKVYQDSPLYNEQDELFIKNIKEFYNEVSIKIEFLNLENERFNKEVKKVFDFFGEEETPKLTAEIMIRYISKFTIAFEV